MPVTIIENPSPGIAKKYVFTGIHAIRAEIILKKIQKEKTKKIKEK